MVLKLEYNGWSGRVAVGSEVYEDDKRYFVTQIIKIESFDGDTYVYVLATESKSIDE